MRKNEWTVYLTQAVLLFCLMVIAFPRVFFHGEYTVPAQLLYCVPPWETLDPAFGDRGHHMMSDVITLMNTWYSVASMAIKNGEWPLWNPYELFGMPLLANSQSTCLYPFRLVHLIFGIQLGMTLYILLKMFLCGMTSFICARGLGLSVLASRFVSVSWMLCGYVMAFLYWPLPDLAVWVPLMFLGAEWIAQTLYRRGFLMLTFSAAMLLLAGHPETAFSFGMGLGIYFLLRVFLGHRHTGALVAPLAVAGAAWGLALAIAGAQILPLAEYIANSYTAVARQDFDAYSRYPFTPSSVAGLWVPRIFGTALDHNYWGPVNSIVAGILYPGVLVWGLFALGMVKAKTPRPLDAPRWIALALSGVITFAMSVDAPVFDALFHYPPFNTMLHHYLLVWVLISLPLLAGIGLDRWLATPRSVRELWPAILMNLLGAGIVGFVLWFAWGLIGAKQAHEHVIAQALTALIVAVLGIFLLAGATRPRLRTACAIGLTLLTAADLLWAARGMNPTSPPEKAYPATALIRYLQDLPQPTRVISDTTIIPTGILASFGIQEGMSYDGIYPMRGMRYYRELPLGMPWKNYGAMSGFEYYLRDPRYPQLFPDYLQERTELVTHLEGLDVMRDRTVFPRAYWIGKARVARTPDEAFDLLKTAAFDPRAEAALELPENVPAPANGEGFVAATIAEYRSTYVRIEVDAPSPGTLVLSDAYYPGWRATIDEAPAKIYPANYLFRGVLVDTGKHTIEFYYFPMSFKVGLVLSATGILVFIGLLLIRPRRTSRVT